jgi:hypothetical protein
MYNLVRNSGSFPDTHYSKAIFVPKGSEYCRKFGICLFCTTNKAALLLHLSVFKYTEQLKHEQFCILRGKFT